MILLKNNLKNLVRLDNPKTSRLGYLRLDKNENLIPIGQDFIDLVKSKINQDLISTYPEVYSLYQKISDWLAVDLDQIYVSAGSDGAIKAVFEVFVEEGDEVISLHPTYAMYSVYSKMFGANLKKIEYNHDLTLQYDKIIQSITDRTKLICIANPNSPTGTIIKKLDLFEIIEYAQEKDVLVLIDEAYHMYYPETFISDVSSFSNLIVTRSFTKALGLASARLGFAVSNPYIIGCLKKVRPIYEVNSFSILLGKLIIDNENVVMENMKRFNEGKQYLLESLDSIGIKFFNTYANFILIDVGTQERALNIKEELYKRKILINGGYTDIPLDRCIRASISEKKHMQIFVDNLNDVLEIMNGTGQNNA